MWPRNAKNAAKLNVTVNNGEVLWLNQLRKAARKLKAERGANMPLNAKGKKIKKAMKKEYGEEKGEKIFYASENKGTIKGVTKKKKKKK